MLSKRKINLNKLCLKKLALVVIQIGALFLQKKRIFHCIKYKLLPVKEPVVLQKEVSFMKIEVLVQYLRLWFLE